VELRHLRYFVALAEELHFGRAANRLHIVQPALSKQILALERELGVELLDRTHGVTLTPAGAVFYEEASAILDRVSEAVRSAQGTARGELGSLDVGFVGPAMWSVLPWILREHRRAHPNLRYRLFELGSPEQMERLRAGTLDVGFLRPIAVDDALVFKPVWREQFVVALADDHPLAGTGRIDLADLKDERFVVLPRRMAPNLSDTSLSICLSYGFSPKVVEEGNSPSALVMVAMGLCVALIPESARNAGFKGITFRPLIRPTPEQDLAVAYRAEDRSPALRAFLATISSVVRGVQAPGQPPAELVAG